MKTALLITPSFYPTPHVSSIRATQWACLLPHFGWRVIVVTRPYAGDIHAVTSSVEPLRSADIRYIGRPLSTLQDGPRTSVGTSVRGAIGKALSAYVLAPDPGIIQWRKLRTAVLSIAAQVHPDVVITTAPPNSIHTLGLAVKRSIPSVVWISDFRDVFRREGRYRVSLLELLRHRATVQFERRVYSSADIITCAIPLHARWIARRFPQYTNKTRIILNGTPDILCSASLMPPSVRDRVLQIKTVGNCGESEALTLALAIKQLNEGPQQYAISFIGKRPTASSSIERVLGSAARFTGRLPHDQAIQEMLSADMLIALSSVSRSRQFFLTSKLFEYLAIPIPVIVVNPTGPDRCMFSKLAELLFLYNPQVHEVGRAIQTCTRPDATQLLQRSEFVRAQWSRRSQVGSLATAMNALIEGKTDRTDCA